jgi:hypothetical protein
MSGPSRWVADLALGCRLALAGGRRSVGRIALTAVSTGVGVAVLLLAAAVPTMWQAREERSTAISYQGVSPEAAHPAGVDPLYVISAGTRYHEKYIQGRYVKAGGPHAPVPPGLDRIPAPGEVYLSPALARLLASDAGALLRPRFGQRVAGTIGKAGLTSPGEYRFFAGTATTTGYRYDSASVVYAFGDPAGGPASPLPPVLWLLLVLGVVALLAPVLIFVATAGRIGGLARDRRLAALRLVGAGIQQTRRIAAGEALAGALAGLLLGVGGFLLGRALVESVEVYGETFFRSDVRPVWPIAVLILVAVPALAVQVSMLSLRGAAVEPLGVVRQAPVVHRRLWWRIAVGVVGAGALAFGLDGLQTAGPRDTAILVTGISMLLLSVPLLLPWLVERLVRWLPHGPVSWELAVRRLRLDGAAPSRVVGGVAVVLAGAIALQSVLATAESDLRTGAILPPDAPDQQTVVVDGAALSHVDEVSTALAAIPGVRQVADRRRLATTGATEQAGQAVWVADCASATRLLASIRDTPGAGAASTCADGDVFAVSGDDVQARPPQAGQTVTFAVGAPDRPGPRWQVPAGTRKVTLPWSSDLAGALLVTPGALHGVSPLVATVEFRLLADRSDPDTLERVRNAAGPLGWQAEISSITDFTDDSTYAQRYRTIRTGLLLGALVTLLLAGASLLVLALEQIAERRRAMAVLAASGVPRSMLARSVLWQNTVPMAVAVPVAVLSGAVLSRLLLHTVNRPPGVDWSAVVLLVSTSVVLVLLATVLTLPALRRAGRPTELRAE